jgi:hypothetical protein
VRETEHDEPPPPGTITRWFMPIGREGRAITGPEADDGMTAGQIALCNQCSRPDRLVYHDC